MNKDNLIWLILSAYGVWFAVLSGIEEMSDGKYWKAVLAFIFGIISYWIFVKKVKK